MSGDTKGQVMGNYGQRAVNMVRGEGVYLYDDRGRAYLDFTAGIAVVNLGHAHPEVTRAIAEQAGTLVHCSNLYGIPLQQSLASKLALQSGGHLNRAFFCNSGAEANEAAMKLARKYAARTENESLPLRTKLVSLPGAFHGRTFGALSITPKPLYHAGYQPLVPNCVTPDTLDGVLAEIDETTAACFVEIVQGEGGLRPLESAYLQEIQAKCRKVGALLVVDEVQTGIGRTGTFFAYSQVGLEPDIVTLAKGLGNGVPIGALLATQHVADAFLPGSHGSTFGGNPLAMAAANQVVDVVSKESFLAHVRTMGEYLSDLLQKRFTGVAGRGLMWGFDVDDAKAFVAAALDAGVLLTAVGDKRVRVVPPLIIEEADIVEFEQRLQNVQA